MGSGRDTRDERGIHFIEHGGEPEYYVTHVRYEPLGNGNVRAFCYTERHKNEFHLLYTAVVPAATIIKIGREAQMIGSEAWNLAQWEANGDAH